MLWWPAGCALLAFVVYKVVRNLWLSHKEISALLKKWDREEDGL